MFIQGENDTWDSYVLFASSPYTNLSSYLVTGSALRASEVYPGRTAALGRAEPGGEDGLWTAPGRCWWGGRAAASGRVCGEAGPPRPAPGKRSGLSGHPKSHGYLNQQ
jgi:hypothetical protein